jgi:sterol desaturase/sphingolipid hydroxylase (fatty acid hydroxylase superfamily)
MNEIIAMVESLTTFFMSLIDRGDTYLFLVPIYGALILGERAAHEVMSKRPWNSLDASANVAITVAQLGLNVVIGHLLPVAVLAWLFANFRLFTLGDGVGGWVAAFILYDLSWYVDHRIGHRVGLFWAMHQVHHSSTEYNMTVASRGFIFDITLVPRPTFYLLPILGVSPGQFVVIVIFSNIWGIAQHTRLINTLGWLDWLIATPSNHRVHHGCDAKYLDRNYGEVLMIWDHLFGTYQAEEEEPRFGVIDPVETYNPVRIQVEGLRRLIRKTRAARRWRDKLRCVYKPPGWAPAEATKVRARA